jgi:transcriptional regulator with XRE-family HTH domain
VDENKDSLEGFGARLTQAIAAAGITASEVSRELNVTPQAIYNYEVRDGGIAAAKLFLLADILRVDPSWLATGRPRPIVQRPANTDEVLSSLGSRLDYALRKAGFESQSSLSRASGVPQATISRVLNVDGASGPELETVRKLASACGVSVAWLAEGINDAEVPFALSNLQMDWLELLEDLGSDDIAEFREFINKRQLRNRKLILELGHKRP